MSQATQKDPQPAVRESRLLKRAVALGLQLPLDLERIAIERGCDYYQREIGPRAVPLGRVPISNAELAVALVSPFLYPTLREIRLAAAVLGAQDVQSEEVAMLAVQEQCAGLIRYIAVCGHGYEPENPLWNSLLTLLPDSDSQPEVLPHPTRFVEMTGIDRGKIGVFTRWIRPRGRAAA
jgi:hypothetical protein